VGPAAAPTQRPQPPARSRCPASGAQSRWTADRGQAPERAAPAPEAPQWPQQAGPATFRRNAPGHEQIRSGIPSRAVQASGVINSGLQAAVALCRWCRRDTNQNDSRRFDGNDGPLGGHISATNKNQGRNWLDFSPESTGLSKIAIGARRPGSRCREMAAGSAGRRTPRGAASCRGGPQTSG
jgi:hypothetical protein